MFLPRLALLPTLSSLPPSCSPVLPAPQIVAHLEDLLQEPRAPQAALDDAHLSASALLAVEQHRFASTELGQRLLKDLCSAPLQRLTPATVKLAMFSWAWVSGGGRVGGWLRCWRGARHTTWGGQPTKSSGADGQGHPECPAAAH